jgi:hypothetical protein
MPEAQQLNRYPNQYASIRRGYTEENKFTRRDTDGRETNAK